MNLAKKYNKRQQGSQGVVGNERVSVWLDFIRNGIAIHVISREIGQKEPKRAWTGEKIEEVPEGYPIPNFLFIPNQIIEEFPNLLEALSEALQDFLGVKEDD